MQLLNELKKYDAKTSLKKDPILEIENILKNLKQIDEKLLLSAGFSGSLKSYSNIKDKEDRYEKAKAIIEHFGKENIFKTSSIKKLAINYGLRFLPTYLYKGSVPSELTLKIKEFTRKVPNGERYLSNSFILAPANVFNLEPKQKDPLYFVQLTENTDGEENLYYLVHQWGAEINPWRKLINLPQRSTWTVLPIALIVFFSSMFLIFNFTTRNPDHAILDFRYLLFLPCGLLALSSTLLFKNNSQEWDSTQM